MTNHSPLVIGIGELLWDMLPGGKKMGGAPANFIYHISEFGCYGQILSSVGKDKMGKELLEELQRKKLGRQLISINSNYPTGTVSVTIDRDGTPSYNIHSGVAWDNIILDNHTITEIKSADAVCFGSLAQRNEVSGKSIRAVLNSVNKKCIKVFDINLRQDFFSEDVIINSLRLANILKINEKELTVVSRLLKIEGDEIEIMNSLLRSFGLDLIALTKGSDSSILLTANEVSRIRTPKVKVADTVGAGDSFTAVLISGLLNGQKIKKIHKNAVDISAWVCTKAGATPSYEKFIKRGNMFM